MTTIINPGSGNKWEDAIQVKDEADWRIVNDCLMLVAGWMTRGGRKANKQLFGTIAWNAAEFYDPDYMGKFMYYLRKVIETKPNAYQTWSERVTRSEASKG